MEILLQCPLCKFSYATHPEKKRLGVNYYTVYNTDNNICQVHDFAGNHTTVIYLTNYKFDLLFESALNAIKDMYYREAIASLTAAMERFFEFAIYVMKKKKKLGNLFLINRKDSWVHSIFSFLISLVRDLIP